MKKTAAILASIATLCVGSMSAFAADGTTGGGNIIDGVLNGAEDIVDGVVSGAEDIITPGGSTGGVEESTDDNMSMPDTTSQVTPGDSTSNTDNVNTGVPAFELAALGAAAVGGLTAMAITVRKNNK